MEAGKGGQGQIDPTLAWGPDGSPVLIWKTDGNADKKPTPIRYAKLTPNGLGFAVGPSWATTQLITDTLAWEHGIVEAPWVVPHGGQFFLFYSGAQFKNGYAVGVARATALEGPYTKKGPPILAGDSFEAPGHCSVIQVADGNWAIVYHAWRGADRTQRHMMLDTLSWGPDGWPFVNGNVPSTAGNTP